VVAFAVTVPLAVLGVGVWSLVIGQAVGYLVAVGVGVLISPYRLRVRFEHRAARRYWHFSAPIAVAAVAALLIAQGTTLSFKLHEGLAAVGFITLAVTLTRYVDRADQIVTASIYPAVCALKEQTRQLEELFIKSNRATLLWVLPFSTALVLFAPDLQHFLLGTKWHPAVVLLQGMAIATALGQLGFNWFSFYRAYGNNRPAAIESAVGATLFLMLAVPGLLLAGAHGFVVGRIIGVAVAVAIRRYYVDRLLPGVRFTAIVRPALLPLCLAVAVPLAVRLAAWGNTRTGLQAALELVLFLAVYGAVTIRSQRELMAELLTTFRGRARPAESH
jgi:O-antigen/teichoic acid export membrane protein